MSDAPVELEWLDPHRFRVGTTEFVETFEIGSAAERFHIRKPRDLVEAYVEMLRPFQGGAVVELGIAQGGSVALMELVASPCTLVALELDPEPVDGLTDFIERRGIGDRVHPYYGIDQGDRARVLEVVAGELHGAPLDLVVDDASHLLEPTRASFETLFPLLRPGGRYLIEDWRWQHQLSEQMGDAEDGEPLSEAFDRSLRAALEQPDSAMHEQFRHAIATRLEHPDPEVRARIGAELAKRLEDPGDRARLEAAVTRPGPAGHGRAGEPSGAARPDAETVDPLPALAIDLMLARATSGDVVADIHIDGSWIWVTRGPARLDPQRFRLADTFIDHMGLRWG